LLKRTTNHTDTTTKDPAHPCLLKHYLEKLSYGNSQDAPLQMNRLKNVLFIYNGILFRHKEK
jgi:hypothetical protein